jgi:hypothetical protein
MPSIAAMMNSAAMLAWRATRMTMCVNYLPRPRLCGVFGAPDPDPPEPDPPE